ncbi:DUF456 domain-containing protein [Desulfovibrio sp.]|uniref:DUF456 domain-containing protein n=1 Tax=Desulfovibrio sp. TaxID=885 RepID=UPI0023C6AE96|nr:DUF456 domain-containing protein [Desulfovibrio sp.]MDE7240721.1 DUF456 domain-containing protein [Desulfovibrio sp.]
MEVFPFASLLAGAFLTLLCFVLFLNIFGLPANWIILGLVALWKLLLPGQGQLGVWFWAGMVAFALLGEALELGVQVVKARHYGSSSSGTFAGMVGAFVGAILLAPLFWGLGALLGALLGAWLGCYLMEVAKGRPSSEAMNAAMGAMMGRFLGTVCKCGTGAAMIALTAHHIWPDLAEPEAPAEVLGILLHALIAC